MLARLVELILFGFLLWLAYEGVKARVRAFFSGGSPGPRQGPRPPAGRPGETLVRCAACGTHVPQSRALLAESGSAVYCSERCRGADRKRG